LEELAVQDTRALRSLTGSAVRSYSGAGGVVHTDVMVRTAEEVGAALAGRLARGHAASLGARGRSGSGRRTSTGTARFFAVGAHVGLVLISAVSRGGPGGAAGRLISASGRSRGRVASTTALFASEGSETVVSSLGAVALLSPVRAVLVLIDASTRSRLSITSVAVGAHSGVSSVVHADMVLGAAEQVVSALAG
jgi:hypothetical protein